MNTENINIEDIKIGEMYNVRVKVCKMTSAGLVCHACDKDGINLNEHPNFFTESEVEAFSPITPENGKKNTEPAPKYDPCRKFRRGDKVRVVKCNGRIGSTSAPVGMLAIVTEDEKECSWIYLTTKECDYSIDPAYLELVSPVEELERYVVEPSDVAYFIVDKKHERGEQNVVMYMFAFHPHAKEAAEAECARLNDAYRKECNNA